MQSKHRVLSENDNFPSFATVLVKINLQYLISLLIFVVIADFHLQIL